MTDKSTERAFELMVGVTCLIAMIFVAGMLIFAWFVMVPLVPHQVGAKLIWMLLATLNVVGFASALSWFRHG